MATLCVNDIILVERKVEVPEICTCGADLTEPASIVVWQWNDAYWKGRLGDTNTMRDDLDEYDDGDGVLITTDTGSQSGEGWLNGGAYYCATCHATLGEQRVIDGDKTPEETRAALRAAVESGTTPENVTPQ